MRSSVVFVASVLTVLGTAVTPAAAAPAEAVRGALVTAVPVGGSPTPGGRPPRSVQGEPGESAARLQARVRPPAMTADQMLADQKARYGLATHDYRPPAETGPASWTGEDHITTPDCQAKFREPGFRGPWHYRNHYSACHVEDFTILYYDCPNPPGPGCNVIGTLTFRATFVGRSFHRERKIIWEIYVDHWRPTRVQNDETLVNIDVDCFIAGNELGACNEDTAPGIVKRVIGWKLGPREFITNLPTTTRPDPSKPPEVQSEMRGHYTYIPTVITRYASRPSVAQSDETVGRCDNAPYITLAAAQCSFTGTAGIYHLDYYYDSLTLMVNQSSALIWEAMYHIDRTRPGLIGTYVPGSVTRVPFSRFRHPLTRKVYGAVSRTRIQAECRAGWGDNYTDPPDPTGPPPFNERRECDEYPFASTYESAYDDDSGTAASWAVRPVAASHNNHNGGARLRDFYSNDALLERDPFFVQIHNAPSN